MTAVKPGAPLPFRGVQNPLAPRRALPEKSRQIKAWVRETYGLDEDVVVSITEIACRDDGCADIETVVGIMRPGQPIETVRLHKPLAEVERSDIAPPGAATA